MEVGVGLGEGRGRQDQRKVLTVRYKGLRKGLQVCHSACGWVALFPRKHFLAVPDTG